jgi:hypothetical protein
VEKGRLLNQPSRCGVASSDVTGCALKCCVRSLEEPPSKDSGLASTRSSCNVVDNEVYVCLLQRRLPICLLLYPLTALLIQKHVPKTVIVMPQIRGISGAVTKSLFVEALLKSLHSDPEVCSFYSHSSGMRVIFPCNILENMRTVRQNACCQPRKARWFAKERRWDQKRRFLESYHDLIYN